MKVVLPKNYKKIFTVEEYEIAREIIKYEKDNDGYTEKDWAEYAVREALKDNKYGWLEDIITAKAEICKNKNANCWDRYFEGSHDLDVFITILAKVSGTSGTSYYAYIEIGAYLSDIWESGAKDYRNNMIIEKYIKDEK